MPSYKARMAMPVFALYAEDGSLVATVRRPNPYRARSAFHELPEWARRGGVRVGYLRR